MPNPHSSSGGTLSSEIASEAAECRLSGGPCQCEYSWHADRYEEWADRVSQLESALTTERLAHQEQLVEQRVIGHGEGQEHAIADVNAGRIDDLIRPRLDQADAAFLVCQQELDIQQVAYGREIMAHREAEAKLADAEAHLSASRQVIEKVVQEMRQESAEVKRIGGEVPYWQVDEWATQLSGITGSATT